jgi:hypothetical protein
VEYVKGRGSRNLKGGVGLRVTRVSQQTVRFVHHTSGPSLLVSSPFSGFAHRWLFDEAKNVPGMFQFCAKNGYQLVTFGNKPKKKKPGNPGSFSLVSLLVLRLFPSMQRFESFAASNGRRRDGFSTTTKIGRARKPCSHMLMSASSVCLT